MNKGTLFLLGIGGALMVIGRKKIAQVGSTVIDATKRGIFVAVIPDAAEPYADVILQVAAEDDVNALLIVALGEQESGWTYGAGYTPKGDPRGTGDAGHGHGIMQIDDRTWGEWLAANDWGDPYTNIKKGVSILKSDLAYFAAKGVSGDAQVQAAISAYNHGPGNVWKNVSAGRAPDAGLPNPSYSTQVLARLASLTSDFNSSVA